AHPVLASSSSKALRFHPVLAFCPAAAVFAARFLAASFLTAIRRLSKSAANRAPCRFHSDTRNEISACRKDTCGRSFAKTRSRARRGPVSFCGAVGRSGRVMDARNPQRVSSAGGAASPPLLSVRGLGIRFKTSHGVWQATRKVSFDIAPGERVGIVG